MQINVNTDKTIDRHTGLDSHVQTVVETAIGRFSEHVSRVEIHLSDNKGEKSLDGDNRCLMEARVNGLQPVAVSDHAATLHQSISGAADKLKRALDSALGKRADHKRAPLAAEPADEEPAES